MTIRITKILGGILVAMGAAGFFTSCNKSSGGGGTAATSSLGISGILSVNSNSSQSGGISGDYLSQAIDLTQYKVVCSTITAPILSGTATIGADGSFKVNIAGGENQPIACVMTTLAGIKVADFLISDSSKKDMNGKSQSSTSATYKTSADVGSISYDSNAGEVTIPSTNVGSALDTTVVSSSALFDPTGAWTIGAVDFTLPDGVKGPCSGGGGNGCNGPPANQTIFLKLWKGIVTADSSPIAGLQVWNSTANYATCGSLVGLTPTIKSSIGVDFSQNGSSDAAYTFASSVPNFVDKVTGGTSTVTLTNGWQMSTATSQWDLFPACGPTNLTIGVTTYTNAWVCGPDGTNYMGSLGGGCQDSAGNNVQLTNWAGVNTCSTVTDSNFVNTQTCSGTATINSVSTAVTCINKWVIMTKSGSVYTPVNGGAFNWTNLTKIPAGTACSAISTATESSKIAQLQCYANYYYQSGMEQASACLPKVDLDWSATTSASFAMVDSIRPQGLVFFDKYTPHPDGNGGSLTSRQERFEGVQVNGNNWVNCRVIEVGSISMRKVTTNKLFVTYQSSTVSSSTAKPACMAKFSGKRETFVFYLTR